MNCVNHPENPVSAYCQNCGKAMCANCVRSVSGVIYCEPCLAERLGMGSAAPGTGIPGVFAPQSGPNPGVAFGLGFIPGVGAFYNGQFVKGLIHVVVFVILIGITSHIGVFGILIAAWVIYQVFDAYHTARARRDGTPLPDPFGLNDLGAKFGIPNPTTGPGPIWGHRPSQNPVPPPPASGFAPSAGFTDPYAPPYSDVPPPPGVVPPPPVASGLCSRRRPTGAVILIVLGVIFLLNSMDFFHFDWFGHLWPVLIIAFGVFLFLDRSRRQPPRPPMPPSQTPGGPR